MSDAVILPPTQAPASDEGPYATRTITFQGYDYTFTFYMGFASLVTFTPPGSSEAIVVYKQQGVFDCHDTGGPLPTSTLSVNGGPFNLDVEVEIEDGPLTPPEFRGPIESIQIGFKGASQAKAAASATATAKPVPGNKRVKPCRGAHQIARLSVKERVKMGEGGVIAFQDDDGGTLIVNNKAATCPPDC